MLGIFRCTAFVAMSCVSLASAQEQVSVVPPEEMPLNQAEEVPPPPNETEVRLEVELDPDLAAAAARHLDRHVTEPAPSLEDALRDEDRDAALQAIQLGRTPTLACLEALLLEERVRSFYVPPLEGDALTLRVVSTQARTLVSTIEPLRFAYARCLATIEDAPQFGQSRQTFVDRAEELERVRELATGDDLALAHPGMLALVEHAPEADWEHVTALYVAVHGQIRPDPEAESLAGWQSAAVISTGLLFITPLISMVVGIRVDTVETGRFMLGSLGVMVGAFPGVMLGRTWSNPESEWTPHRLMAGALLTLGAIGGGIALFRADLKRRHQIFGATMAGTAVGNLVWLAGGLGIYRRHRDGRRPNVRGLRGRPTVEISDEHGSIGWAGSF